MYWEGCKVVQEKSVYGSLWQSTGLMLTYVETEATRLDQRCQPIGDIEAEMTCHLVWDPDLHCKTTV